MRVATTACTLIPLAERMSSMAKTLAGSLMATSSRPFSNPMGIELWRLQTLPGTFVSAAPSRVNSVRSTNRIPICAARARTTWDSVSMPRSMSTRPRECPAPRCSDNAALNWSAVIRPWDTRMSPSCFILRAPP